MAIAFLYNEVRKLDKVVKKLTPGELVDLPAATQADPRDAAEFAVDKHVQEYHKRN
jgi:hypothetical protein